MVLINPQDIIRQYRALLDQLKSVHTLNDFDQWSEKLTEHRFTQSQLKNAWHFSQIMGNSIVMKELYQQVEIVAPTDTTVVIYGESGTGKYILAQVVHSISARREKSFVVAGCASMSSEMLEKKMFGYENEVGYLELAQGGTLYIDDIESSSLELQSRLLRILQEQRFTPLGSTQHQQLDVRLIVTTQRDLVKLVSSKQFSRELYRQLDRFSLLMPALRDRQEDIPILLRSSIELFSENISRKDPQISQQAMERLVNYYWPGNIRELFDLIAVAVVLSNGSEIDISALPLHISKQSQTIKFQPDYLPNINSINDRLNLTNRERIRILEALREANGKIGGINGAASKLALAPSTLRSRMYRLGIDRALLANYLNMCKDDSTQ